MRQTAATRDTSTPDGTCRPHTYQTSATRLHFPSSGVLPFLRFFEISPIRRTGVRFLHILPEYFFFSGDYSAFAGRNLGKGVRKRERERGVVGRGKSAIFASFSKVCEKVCELPPKQTLFQHYSKKCFKKCVKQGQNTHFFSTERNST